MIILPWLLGGLSKGLEVVKSLILTDVAFFMQISLSGVFFFFIVSVLLPETRFWALVSVLSTTENPNIPLTIMHLCTRVPPPNAPLSYPLCELIKLALNS